MRIIGIEDLHCNAGWRTLSFLKITTDEGIVGWSDVELRDLGPEFVHWYRDLCQRIAAKRDEITSEFGRGWYEFVAREYAGILDMVRAGVLGGLLVRARRP